MNLNLINRKFYKTSDLKNQSGRVGYLILYFLGAPVGLLILLWVVLGNNIFGSG